MVLQYLVNCWHIDVHDDKNFHDDEKFHTYQSVKLKHDGIWGLGICDLSGWGIYGPNGWGIYDPNGWGTYSSEKIGSFTTS